MIIPVELSPNTSNPKLPQGLAKISNDEIVLIELQGQLEVEAKSPSERNGKFIGTLSIDETIVSALNLLHSSSAALYTVTDERGAIE